MLRVPGQVLSQPSDLKFPRPPTSALAQLPGELLSAVVDATDSSDLQNLHRAWPGIEARSGHVIDVHLQSIFPKSFLSLEPARRWQLKHQVYRGAQNMAAGRVCERDLTAFCHSTMVMLAADGGFVQTFLDAQDRISSYTSRIAPEVLHDISNQIGVDENALSTEDALRNTMIASRDDRWLAHLDQPRPFKRFFDDRRTGSFGQSSFTPCPIWSVPAYKLLQAQGVPLTLIDAGQQPPSSSTIMLMGPKPAFCFTQDASHLLVIQRSLLARRAYAGGGILALQPHGGKTAWYRLPPAVRALPLVPDRALRQLGRTAFLVVGAQGFIVVDAVTQQTCNIERKAGEVLHDAAIWNASGHWFGFSTNKCLHVLTCSKTSALQQVQEIILAPQPYGSLTQVRLIPAFPTPNYVAAFRGNDLITWAEYKPDQAHIQPWLTIARGTEVMTTVGGRRTGLTEVVDRTHAPNMFFLVEYPNTQASPSIAQPELVAYSRDDGGWRRRLLGVVRAEPADPVTLDMSPCGQMLIAKTPSNEARVVHLRSEATSPTNIDMPHWLGDSENLFFSAFNGYILGLFPNAQDPPSKFKNKIRTMLTDPNLRDKRGVQFAQKTASFTGSNYRRSALAFFTPGLQGWNFQWATFVYDYQLSTVSRDGTAMILSEFESHMFVDFSF